MYTDEVLGMCTCIEGVVDNVPRTERPVSEDINGPAF